MDNLEKLAIALELEDIYSGCTWRGCSNNNNSSSCCCCSNDNSNNKNNGNKFDNNKSNNNNKSKADEDPLLRPKIRRFDATTWHLWLQ